MDSRAHRRSVLSQKSSSASSGSHTTASRSTRRSLVFDHESSLFISPALSPASIADDSCADSIWFLDLDSPSLPPDLPAVPHHHTDYRKPSSRHSALYHNNSPSHNAKTAHSRAQSDAHACDHTKLSIHPPALHSNRDSFVSIVNDPFFQSLQLGSSPDAPSLDSIAQTIAIEEAHRARDKQLDIAYTTSFIDTDPDPDFDSEGQLDELPYVEEEVALSPRYSGPAKVFHAAGQQDWARFQRRQSLMIDPMHPGQSRYSHSRKFEAMDGLNIAVVGASGVGKSAFIQQVVGLSRPPLSDATTLSFSINNTTYPVTLFELNLEAFDFGPAQPFQWPKQINGHITPQVDGALILYDVTNIESTRDLHKTLILVACKCDRPPNCREVNAEVMANHERFKACAGSVASSSNNPEQARIGLSTILRAALHMRRGRGRFQNGSTLGRLAWLQRRSTAQQSAIHSTPYSTLHSTAQHSALHHSTTP
ncbi:Ras guanine nucleotide exchange factor A [Ceratocystis lukuohia]|uniref:Ras guanine nucleotide exchange factor A n=1 Tax=Ceratocystis lukuohia TaxID=2019550 RepID=A0ABR4MR33_9PEZI